MSIVFKHTIKNIFGKPLRTLVVTFSIFMCALSALLCFDLLTELKVQFKEMYTAVLGNADIILYHPMELTSDVPLNTSVGIITDTTYFYKDIEGEYNYAHGQSVSLYSFDFEAASEMGIYRRYVPEDGEVVLSARFAREFGYSVGDPIEMLDSNDEKHMMTVGEILPPDSLSIFESGYSAIMNGNTMTEFAGSSRAETTLLFIDVLDNSQVGDMVDAIEDISPGANYEVVSDMDELNEMMDQVTAVMFLIFAVSILLVVFVTFSICEKIISERMSVVGTLRSLGLSNRRTA
ncbi:MAG: hypothetical protein J5685_01005, partial [Clostridiales bacterium]|nr:hypothetical protein [Clostridiales bacterium]